LQTNRGEQNVDESLGTLSHRCRQLRCHGKRFVAWRQHRCRTFRDRMGRR
jgi:hypothetical protein